MTNIVIATAVVALILIGGAIYDHLSVAERHAACQRAGGVYVVSVSGQVCAKALRD